MQNSHSKLILLLSPIILIAAFVTNPVFDDWTYITTPCDFTKDNFQNLLLNGNQWRPFDGALGYLLWLKPSLFPWVNHVIVVIGHVLNALLLCRVGKLFKLDSLPLYIAIIIFYLSPAMVATVTNTDSINQVYSHLWGFLGLYIYLAYEGKRKILLWCTMVLLASLSKENGIMWAWATPIIAWGLNTEKKKLITRDLIIGTIIVALYLIIRFSTAGHLIDTDSTYIHFPLYARIKGLFKFIGYSVVPLDYVSIVYAPSRNILLALLTAILSLPFIILGIKNVVKSDRRIVISLVLAIILLALPHLMTIYTALHPYASLSLCSILIAVIIQKERNRRKVIYTFGLYFAAIIISTYHHWISSYESGMTGKRMAEKAIERTAHPVDSVYVIYIFNDEQKYSSFCTIPFEAFGWGIAATNQTGYKWPKHIYTEQIDAKDKTSLDTFISKGRNAGYRTFWIIDKDSINVLNE